MSARRGRAVRRRAGQRLAWRWYWQRAETATQRPWADGWPSYADARTYLTSHWPWALPWEPPDRVFPMIYYGHVASLRRGA